MIRNFLLLFIMAVGLSCAHSAKHICDTNDCSFGSNLSHLGRFVSVSRFVNLHDSTQVLEQKTIVGFEIDFQKNALHLTAYLEEEDIRYRYTKRDTCIWKDPCIEFFFDPGADGLDYYEIQFNAYPQVWDLKLKGTGTRVNAPDNMIDWDIGENFGLQKRSGTPNQSNDKDAFWSIVATVDWNKISEGKPKTGDTWAYNFMRVDYDEKGVPTYWVAAPTDHTNIHVPAKWPTVTF